MILWGYVYGNVIYVYTKQDSIVYAVVVTLNILNMSLLDWWQQHVRWRGSKLSGSVYKKQDMLTCTNPDNIKYVNDVYTDKYECLTKIKQTNKNKNKILHCGTIPNI